MTVAVCLEIAGIVIFLRAWRAIEAMGTARRGAETRWWYRRKRGSARRRSRQKIAVEGPRASVSLCVLGARFGLPK